jgi:hypothetical protein
MAVWLFFCQVSLSLFNCRVHASHGFSFVRSVSAFLTAEFTHRMAFLLLNLAFLVGVSDYFSGRVSLSCCKYKVRASHGISFAFGEVLTMHLI